jgi:chorismate dehydratase
VPKLRVGFFNAIDCRPLAWGFLKGHHGDLFAPSRHPPSMLAQMLRQGNLDIALLPTVDVPLIPSLRLLPDICLAVRGQARTAVLVSQGELEADSRVAVDPGSRQGVTLLSLLWLDRFGCRPDVVPVRPDPDRMLREHDAALLIGNDAFQIDAERYALTPLAGWWESMTGLPCVFAVWAVRPGVQLPDLSFYFKSSLRYGMSLKENMLREAAGETGLDVAEIERHFDQYQSYFLRQEELQGLEELYRRMTAAGLLDQPVELNFWE